MKAEADFLKRRLAYPSYRQPSHVTFGTGSVRVLADPQMLDRAVLLVSGAAGVRDTLSAAFAKQGVPWSSLRTLTKPQGEPTGDSISAGAVWLSANEHDAVIAVGGGSVLDWARLAVAASRGWLDLDSGRLRASTPRLEPSEIVLVPTTCGSGAEAAGVAVYALNDRKVPVVSDAFLADRVILDAQFLSTAQPVALASWLCDALSHSIEAFVSIVPNGLAKQAALSALATILQHHSAHDAHCRNERLMEAGYLGGVAASNCSVGVTHAFAHSIAYYGVPHGVGNALGLAAGIATNAETSEMHALLERARFKSTDALTAAMDPIISTALADSRAKRARAALDASADREDVVKRMLSDVCLRTNPRRLDREGVLAFLEHVDRLLAPI